MSIIIISGLSGSGKTTALRTLEDLGFYCVDNLPVMLLPKFIDLCKSSSDDIARVALVMDAREGPFLKEFEPTIQLLQDEGYRIERIFLESSDSVLVQRFSETRRQHPLSESGSVSEGIARERELIANVKNQADRVIDTSDLNVHQLKRIFEKYFNEIPKRDMAITFMSFGFKYGVPSDVDIVFDVRFLPNPFFVRELRMCDGNDERVADYVFSWPESQELIQKLQELLLFQIPLFSREGKAYLTVAVGCTGGRHRSVAITNHLKNNFSSTRDRVYVIHRDIEKQ
ncbi:RNase adapter RapZ [Thermodesulfobacteriota bacterium]